MLGARGAFEVGVVLLAHGGPGGASHTSSLVRDFGIPDGLVVWSRYYLGGGAGAWWFGHGLQPVDWPVGVLGAYSGSGRAWWLGRYPTCPPDALCHGSGDCRSVFAAAPPQAAAHMGKSPPKNTLWGSSAAACGFQKGEHRCIALANVTNISCTGQRSSNDFSFSKTTGGT